MIILPNEIHEDAAPLDPATIEVAGEGGPDAFFSSLDGKNVFVNFKDKSCAVGLLHNLTWGKGFQVGNNNEYFSFDSMQSFREV